MTSKVIPPFNSRAEMRELLARWPVKGRIVEQMMIYDPDTSGEILSDFDEYGNHWVGTEECLTVPPKLPASWLRIRQYFRDLVAEEGFDPTLLETFERKYIDQEDRETFGQRLLLDR